MSAFFPAPVYGQYWLWFHDFLFDNHHRVASANAQNTAIRWVVFRPVALHTVTSASIYAQTCLCLFGR